MKTSKETIDKQIEEILELKSMGWTDPQIIAEVKLTKAQFLKRMEVLRESEHFKVEALQFLVETAHRLRWARMRSFVDYKAWKEKGQYNAASAAFRRMVDIDIALPKICADMGWSVDELKHFFKHEKLNKDLKNQSHDDLYAEYKKIVRSDA